MKTLLTLLFSLLLVPCYSQSLELDLAKHKNGSLIQTIDPMTINEIVISNRLPNKSVIYNYSVRKEKKQIGPFAGDFNKNILSNGACSSLNQAIVNILDSDDETKIPSLKMSMENEKLKADQNVCSKQINQADSILSQLKSSIKLSYPIKIKSGERVTIEITRGNEKWKFIFETEIEEHWKVYYGFTYVLPAFLTKFDNYYCENIGNDSFVITKSNQNKKTSLLNMTPTVMMSYVFFKPRNINRPLKFALTGGFQSDLDKVSALFGMSAIIGDNLSVNTGAAFLQKYALRGQYSRGQVVREKFEFGQLHEPIWTCDIFFSIAFRFANNPFNKQSVTEVK